MATEGKPADQDWLLFHFSSVKVFGENALIAAPMGQGVMRKYTSGNWERVEEGLPPQTHVNRLYVQERLLSACTNNGLFYYTGEQWEASSLAIGCYQFRQVGKTSLAATQYGFWSGMRDHWHNLAFPNEIVYDFLYLPQYIILGMEQGVAIYDRLEDDWMEFKLGAAVTSLAVFGGRVIGVTEQGELMQGDGRGGFHTFSFDGLFLFSVVTKGKDVYLCCDRGLYRLGLVGGRISLISLKLGCPVTDIDTDGDQMYLATLFEGVQTMGNER
ncbi:hypothetical protein [Paenibacillus sp. SYP-B4298]|uniref:hypothetical protein n=1 Tax=Paenibacillus sp. SYP-B4298 TaxID=2996034 RepID=UPI0022DE6D69|nr:hypothetical protein [Paenibacillus sp. SYP-B4298]